MSTSRAIIAAIVCAAAAFVAGYAHEAEACGQCHGDKVAAVYDHAVVVRALKDGHGVEFVEVNGTFRMTGEDNAALAREIAAVQGVDAGTVRVSANPSAASFAFDPRKTSKDAALAAANGRVAGRRWVLAHLQIIGPSEKK